MDVMFVTRQQAANYLGLSSHAIRRLEAKGTLKSITFPVGIVRFATAHLVSVKDQLQANQPADTLPTPQPTKEPAKVNIAQSVIRRRQATLPFEDADIYFSTPKTAVATG